jgi:hypothetical protein
MATVVAATLAAPQQAAAIPGVERAAAFSKFDDSPSKPAAAYCPDGKRC